MNRENHTRILTYICYPAMVALLALAQSCTNPEPEPREFILAAVRAEDLRKVAEEVHIGASVERLPPLPYEHTAPRGGSIVHLRRTDTTGAGPVTITITNTGGKPLADFGMVANCYGLAWSPDNSKISYSSGGVVYIADSDGKSVKEIHTPPGDATLGASFGFTWSPDGKNLTFIQAEGLQGDSLLNPMRVTITLDQVPPENEE